MRHEALVGQIVATDVTARQVDAREVQLAGNAFWQQRSMRVENERLVVPDRRTDRGKIGPMRRIAFQQMCGYDMRFGRTVLIV